MLSRIQVQRDDQLGSLVFVQLADGWRGEKITYSWFHRNKTCGICYLSKWPLKKTKLAAPSVLYVLIEHKLCLEKKLKLWTWKKMRPATEKSVLIKDKCRNQSQEHKHGARWKHLQCFFNIKRTNSSQEHQHQCCWKEKPKLSTFTPSKVMNITVPAEQWRN